MKLLTIKNVAGLGLGVFFIAIIVDTLPTSGSAALAQSAIMNNVSSTFENFAPDANSPTQDSLSQLLRVGERTFDVEFDSSISSQVMSTGTVRKVAFGKETTVTIVTTASGVYSTDGLTSHHVLYPGVNVTETTPDFGGLVLKVLLNGKYVDWSSLSAAITGS